MNNPLIGSTTLETVQNASNAMSALIVLLSHKDNDLCMLASPIAAALYHASAGNLEN